MKVAIFVASVLSGAAIGLATGNDWLAGFIGMASYVWMKSALDSAE